MVGFVGIEKVINLVFLDEITEKLIDAGEILGIKVLDHVIIGKDKYWSWKEKKGR